MAFIVNRKYTNYGARSDVLGNTFSAAMIFVIKAGTNAPELITEIKAGYGPWITGIADIDKLACFGRIQVLKGEGPSDVVSGLAYPDPTQFVANPSAVLDQSIREQGFDTFLGHGDEPIEIAPSQVCTIILSAAYLDGDAVGTPSATLGRLSVRGHARGGQVRLDEK